MRISWVVAFAGLILSGGLIGFMLTSREATTDGAAAEYRFHARRAYEAVLRESCRPNPALARATVLASEIQTLRSYERHADGAVAFNLGLARSDTKVAGEDLGCWSDDQPTFASMHVEMARDAFSESLGAMKVLERRLSAKVPRYEAPEASAALFRKQIRPMIEGTNPLCASDKGKDPWILAPARSRMVDFRRRLHGSAFALHYDVAEADVLYEQSLTMVECAEPSTEPAESRRQEMTVWAETKIAAIETAFSIR